MAYDIVPSSIILSAGSRMYAIGVCPFLKFVESTCPGSFIQHAFFILFVQS